MLGTLFFLVSLPFQAMKRSNRRMARPKRRAYGKKSRRTPSRAKTGYLRTGGLYGRFKPTGSGPELKFLDVGTPAALVPTNGVMFQDLHILAQGTGPSQRVGRKVQLRAVHIRGSITLQGTDIPVVSSRIRLILGVDTQTNGAAFSASDLITGSFMDGYRNLANSSRFRVWKELKYALNPNSYNSSTDESLGKIWNFTMNHRCSLPLEFLGSTGDLSETKSYSVFLLCFSEANDPITTITFTSRMRYNDSWYVIFRFRVNVKES